MSVKMKEAIPQMVGIADKSLDKRQKSLNVCEHSKKGSRRNLSRCRNKAQLGLKCHPFKLEFPYTCGLIS